jgi:hypothetical protein
MTNNDNSPHDVNKVKKAAKLLLQKENIREKNFNMAHRA